MITYKFPEEKAMLLFYADLLDDLFAREIIEHGVIKNTEEARHLAGFYWRMVEHSNEVEYTEGPYRSDYLLEKIIITFMAYFRSNGYENEWDEFADF